MTEKLYHRFKALMQKNKTDCDKDRNTNDKYGLFQNEPIICRGKNIVKNGKAYTSQLPKFVNCLKNC